MKRRRVEKIRRGGRIRIRNAGESKNKKRHKNDGKKNIGKTLEKRMQKRHDGGEKCVRVF